MNTIGQTMRFLRRKLFEKMGNPKYSRPALFNMDTKLERYLDYRNGFFVEAGANDGYTHSNTYYLEFFKGWRGILVEPIPELFLRCRSERPNSKTYHCALVSREYKEKTITMRYANLMSLVSGSLGDEDMEHYRIMEGIGIGRLEDTYTREVPARTLTDILNENQIPPIDLLSLDVAGYEQAVLQGLDLQKYKPRRICIDTHVNGMSSLSFLLDYYRIEEELSPKDILLVQK